MKYQIHFNNTTFPISEEEIPKVIKAMETKAIVVLTAGVFHGSFISGITRDIHGERGWNYGYKPTGGDGLERKDFITELPERLDKSFNLIERPTLPKPYKEA